MLLLEPPEAIAKKIKRAVTDTEAEVRYDREAKPGVSNLLELLAVATGRTPDELGRGATRSTARSRRTPPTAVVELLRPVQERYARAGRRPRPRRTPCSLARRQVRQAGAGRPGEAVHERMAPQPDEEQERRDRHERKARVHGTVTAAAA